MDTAQWRIKVTTIYQILNKSLRISLTDGENSMSLSFTTILLSQVLKIYKARSTNHWATHYAEFLPIPVISCPLGLTAQSSTDKSTQTAFWKKYAPSLAFTTKSRTDTIVHMMQWWTGKLRKENNVLQTNECCLK